MESLNIQQFIELAPRLGASAATVLVFFFLYKGGFIAAISSWATRQPNNRRIDDLEHFKKVAESNRFHDLEELKADRREMWKAIQEMQKDISGVKADVANINGRLNNGHRT